MSQKLADDLSFARDLRIGLRTAGPGGFASQVMAQTLGRIYGGERLMVIEQDLDAVTEVRVPAGVRIDLFTGDWEELLPILTSRALARFRQRFDAGRTCLVARRASVPIGYTWISHIVDPAIEFLPLALPDDAAYLWDLFVVVSERGSGTGSALTSARLAAAREAGFRLGWRAISPDNRPSIRTAEKTGAVRVLGHLTHRSVFGRVQFREQLRGATPILEKR